jgi:vitamin B12 transporter
LFVRHLRAVAGAAAAFAALSYSAALADPAPQPSPSAAPEIGRVSTSDRHDEPIDRTTRTTFVVDRAQIDARGDRTIADAISGVPGVDIFHYGAFGSQATVFIRGASSTSVEVLFDGVPADQGSNGLIDLGSLSTAGVRRIEIVEGSGSTLYGSSAVGGIINIITAVPNAANVAIGAGSYGDRFVRAGVGTGTIGASFERHIATNDYGWPALSNAGGALAAGTRLNADAESSTGRFAYNAKLGGGFSVQLRASADELAIGVPGSLSFGATTTPRQNVSRTLANLDITHATANSATTLTLAGIHQNLDYVDTASFTENPTIDGRTQVSLRHVIAGGNSTFTGGIDVARESAVLANIATYDAMFNYLGQATIGQAQSESAVYAQEQLAFAGGGQVRAGLRGENDAPLGSALTPSAGFAIPLGNGLQLVSNAGTAFRVPTIIDRYYPGFSNPDLKPERSKDFDAGLHRNLGGGSLVLEYFLRDSSNLIQLDANFVPQNVALASVRGVMGSYRTPAFHGFVSTVAVTDTYLAQSYVPGAAAARLFFVPVFAAKLAVERAFGRGAFAYGVSANLMGPHAESSGFNSDSQTLVDAYLRAKLTRATVLTLRGRNLGDAHYQPVLGYPAPGRTVEVELSTR